MFSSDTLSFKNGSLRDVGERRKEVKEENGRSEGGMVGGMVGGREEMERKREGGGEGVEGKT